MALISVEGVIHDPNGTFPTTGTITFTLNDWFIGADTHIIVQKAESGSISTVDGTFAVSLESTTDGIPTNRNYAVAVSATIEGVAVSVSLGTIVLDNTPTPQQLKDLLGASGGTEALGRHVNRELPAEAINGVNMVYNLVFTPTVNSVMVFLNGRLQQQGAGKDYTIATKQVTFAVPPLTGDVIEFWYFR